MRKNRGFFALLIAAAGAWALGAGSPASAAQKSEPGHSISAQALASHGQSAPGYDRGDDNGDNGGGDYDNGDNGYEDNGYRDNGYEDNGYEDNGYRNGGEEY